MSGHESSKASVEEPSDSQNHDWETIAGDVGNPPRTVDEQVQDFRNILQNFGNRLLDVDDTCTAKRLYEGPPKCKCCINWVEQYPTDVEEEVDDAPNSHNEPLLLRYARSHNKLGGNPLTLHSIVVQSDILRSVVRTVLDSYPGIDAGVEDLQLEAPFEAFFHRWSRLEQQRHGDDPVKAQQTELLYNVLKTELERDMKAAQDLSGHGNITFDLLWTLFPLGNVAPGKIDEQDQCFLVSRSSYESMRGEVHFVLHLTYLDYDGSKFGWQDTSRYIPGFKDTRKIAELPVIPQRYHPNAQDTTNRLRQLGEKVLGLSNGGYKLYQGIAKLQGSGFSFRPDLSDSQRYVEGRIIIDAKGFQQNILHAAVFVDSYPIGLRVLVPDEERPTTKHRQPKPTNNIHIESPDSSNEEPDIEYVVSDHHHKHHRARRDTSSSVGPPPLPDSLPPGAEAAPLDKQRWIQTVFGLPAELFCRPIVRGYCLQSRQWAEFDVSNVQDIEWNERAFDRLVMSSSRKRLLQALVEEQGNHKRDFDDIVQGKGQGLIVLLTGPPGTGKTLTAESIADRLRMPLYMLGAGQLGDRLSEIEDELSRVLRLAASWNAVLLLDEADAFLETRGDDPGSRERNKRVAVFLRVLEYYKGVLILTTNRSVTFDPAFYSRIHLTLRFKSLDHGSRKAVWNNFLQPAGAIFSDESLSELADEDLNGRQIKNIVKMARLLAQNDRQDLKLEHLREVIGVIKDDLGEGAPLWT